MGDDLNDLPLLEKVGVSGCPENACDENRDAADFISHFKGGEGAAREFVEHILKAQGRWDEAVDPSDMTEGPLYFESFRKEEEPCHSM